MNAPFNSPPPLGEDSQANYDYFVERVSETGQIWGLKSKDGWAICPSIEYEDTVVFPFWSDEDYARVHCTEDWKIYTPATLSLEDFLTDWLPGMHEDNVLVGPNWDAEMSGEEVEPADLAARLE